MCFFVSWSLGALLLAIGIVIDMRRLGATRVGIPAIAWIGLSVLIGPMALVAYLVKRRGVRRALVASVWRLVGDSSHPLSVRYARLDALHRMGVVGPSIYLSCRRALRQGLIIHRSKEEQFK
ncbi:hypothetical protein [Hydrogenophaga palleronii]|uniref:hypothetical protein n=1 Tax=Hydrogenophaga palleronii TaxID=65655 RepID=UPI000824CA24|nr:hypothetical protein [Hydrogenophaga palleronii]